MPTIKERIVEIVSDHLGVERAKVEASTSFGELGADDLDQIEIVMFVEEKFGISISDEIIDRMDSVDALDKYVTSRVGVQDHGK